MELINLQIKFEIRWDIKIIQRINHDKIILCVDEANSNEILQYILDANVITEYISIQTILLEKIRIKEKYCKAAVSNKAKDMYEMRFTNNGRNDRIYCKEKSVGERRYIIMIELYQGKKNQSIPNKYKNRIEIMGGYEYEF